MVLLGLLGLVGLGTAATITAALLLSAAGGERWLARRIEGLVEGQTTGGDLRIGALHLDRRGLVLEDVALLDANGARLLTARRLGASLDWGPLLWESRLVLPVVRADDVVVEITADTTGRTDWDRLLPPSEPTTDEEGFRLPMDVAVHSLVVDGLSVRSRGPLGTSFEVTGARAEASLAGHAQRIDLRDLVASAQLATPGPLPVLAQGGVAYDSEQGVLLDALKIDIPRGTAVATGVVGDVMDLGVTVDRIEGSALAPLAGDVGLGGAWSFSAALRGPRSATQVAVAVRGLEGSEGAATLAGTVDLAAEIPRWSLLGQLEGLHVEDLYPAMGEAPTVLQGTLRLEGSGTSPKVDLAMAGTWQGEGLVVADKPIDRLDLAWTIAGGHLEIGKGLVDGILGPMEVGGSVDLMSNALALTLDTPLDPARMNALGAVGLAGNGGLSAEITTAPGSSVIAVTGTVRYAPFVYGPDVRIDRLRAPFHATMEGGRVDVGIDLDGAGLAAYGLTGPGLSADDLRFTRTAEGRMTTVGVVDLPAVAYGDLARFDEVTATLDVLMEGSHRDVRATLATGPWALTDLPGTDGTITARVKDDRTRFEVRLVDHDRTALVTEGRYAMSSAELEVDTLLWRPTPRATWRADGPIRGRIVDGGVTDLRADLRSELGRVEARGTLGTKGPLDAQVRVEGFQLDHLAELWPDKFDLAGDLDLTVDLKGTAEAPAITGEVGLEGLFVGETVRWLNANGGFTWEGGRLSPDLALGVADQPLARISGSMPLTGGLSAPAPDLQGDVDLTLALAPGDFARFAELSPSAEESELPPGEASGVARLTGKLGDPALHVAGVAELAVEGLARKGRVEFTADRVGDRLVFDGDLREDLALRGLVSGGGATRMGEVFAAAFGTGEEVDTADPAVWLDDMEVSTAIVGVPASSLAKAAGSDVLLGGEIVGGFTVTGSPMEPVVDGAVNWVDGRVGDQAFEGMYVALVPAGEGYQLDVSATFPGGGTFDVHGPVPVVVDLERDVKDWSRGPLDLTVTSSGLPLSLLASVDPGITDAKGSLSLTGSVGGPIDDPDPHLVAALEEGSALGYRPLGLVSQGLTGRVELTRDAVTWDLVVPTAPARRQLQGGLVGEAILGEKPRIELDGRLTLEEWAPKEVEAAVRLRDGAWVIATDLDRARLNGDLHVLGDAAAPTVTGDLSLAQGNVALDAAAFVDASTLALDPELKVVRGGEAVATAPPEPPFYADFVVDVDVHLERNLQLDLSIPFVDDLGELGAVLARMDVATRLGGDVEVHLSEGEPTLVGEVDLLEGSVRTLRAQFVVDRGTIAFAGGDPSEDAELDIEATMAVQGGSLHLHVTGTPVAPEFEFQSDEFPSSNEQMVVLLTGTAPDELTSDEGAGAMALAALLWSSVTSGARFGSLSIEPSGAVRLDLPVSQSVRASSSWSVFSDPTENSVTFEIDWSLLHQLVLNAGAGNRIQWGDLYWELRF